MRKLYVSDRQRSISNDVDDLPCIQLLVPLLQLPRKGESVNE